jgi:hypothetical protein
MIGSADVIARYWRKSHPRFVEVKRGEPWIFSK